MLTGTFMVVIQEDRLSVAKLDPAHGTAQEYPEDLFISHLFLRGKHFLESPSARKCAVPTGKGVALIDLDDIYFFKAEHKYVLVRTKETEYLLEDSLKSLETQVGEPFLRVSRNTLVNKNKVVGIAFDRHFTSGDRFNRIVFLDIADTIPVSRRETKKVRSLMRLGGILTLPE